MLYLLDTSLVVPCLVMIMWHRVTRFVLSHLYKNDTPAFQIFKLIVWPEAAEQMIDSLRLESSP